MRTYKIEIEDGNPVVFILDEEGHPVLRQPHHPNAYLAAPWGTEAEAEAWALSQVKELETADANQAQAQLEAEAKALEDAKRLEEIHAMLTKLTTASN